MESSVHTLICLLSLLSCQSKQASVTVDPDSSQVFEGDTVSLSCEDNISAWTVWRNTSRQSGAPCGGAWGRQEGAVCTVGLAVAWDSGVYWCESGHGETSDSISITVTGGSVVLHSPVLPVMEGHEVTLLCKTHTSSDLPTRFYKDDSLISSEPTGHMAIHQVTRHHQGIYRCEMGGEASPSSWMFVRGKPTATPAPLTTSAPPPSLAPPPGSADLHLMFRTVLHLVAFCPYVISTLIMVSLYRHRHTGRERTVSVAMALPTKAEAKEDEDCNDVISISSE